MEAKVVAAREQLLKELEELHKHAKGQKSLYTPVRNSIESVRAAFSRLSDAMDDAASPLIDAQLNIMDVPETPTPLPSRSIPEQHAMVRLTPETLPSAASVEPDEWKKAEGGRKGRKRPDDTANKRDKKKMNLTQKEGAVGPDRREKRDRGRRNLPPSLEKIVISSTGMQKPGEKGGKSYAEVLNELHSTVGTSGGAAVAHSIRRTARGELVVRLRPEAAGAGAMRNILRGAAGPSLQVRHETAKETVIIRDLYEGAEGAENVINSLCRVLGEECRGSVRVKSLRPAFGGTFTCTAEVPRSSESSRMLKEGRVRVGLVMCRVRERVEVRRCFRCLGYGHLAAQCSGEDRHDTCLRCWKGGHKSSKSEAPVRCGLCEKAGAESSHWCGSAKCSMFGAELRRCRNQK